MSRLLNAVFDNDVSKIDALLAGDPRRIADQDAFCQAVGWGHRDAAIFLMDRGADLNARDRNGNTPLQMACMSPDPSLFGDLVRRGSRLQDTSDLTAMAAMHGHTDILRFLYEAGVDLNEGEPQRRPIDAAIGMGEIETARYLLGLRVDSSFIDTAQPLKPWKGSMATPEMMEDIRKLIANNKTEQAHGEQRLPRPESKDES